MIHGSLIKVIIIMWIHQAPMGWQYGKECCADKDCHPVACERIAAVQGGFEYRDYAGATYFFTRDKMKLSQDGECHVCLHKANSWDTNHDQSVKVAPICVYLPVRM
jgi:hypothetical protein